MLRIELAQPGLIGQERQRPMQSLHVRRPRPVGDDGAADRDVVTLVGRDLHAVRETREKADVHQNEERRDRESTPEETCVDSRDRTSGGTGRKRVDHGVILPRR